MTIASTAAIVNATSFACVPIDCQLSSPLSSLFFIVNRIHQVWWWIRRKEVYANPDNFLKLMAGQGINWFAGNTAFVRVIAQTVLVSTRILECVEEQIAIYKEAERCWEALAESPSFLTPRVKWIKAQKGSILSPSTRLYWKKVGAKTRVRVIRIFTTTLLIIKRLFILSMRTMDAIAAFSYTPSTQHEAVGEFFINCSKWVELLLNNKMIMIKSLKNNEKIIRMLLEKLNSPLTYEQLYNGIEGTLELTEQLDQQVKSASDVVAMVAKDALQRSVFGFFQTFGLSELIPVSWIPPLRPPWIEALDAPNEERFPNIIHK